MANADKREPVETVRIADLRELVPAELRELRAYAVEWAEREDSAEFAAWVDEQEARHLARRRGF